MAAEKINVALIGYGYWGTNILRNIVQSTKFGDIYIWDVNPSKSDKACSQYSQVKVAASYEEILLNPAIQAVIIASPTNTHYTLAKAALQHSKHTFVEKPLTTSLSEADELVLLAREQQRILMVDHIFTYSSAVKKLKTYLTKEQIGSLNYIDSTRVNLGVYQSHTNVLWDLACHDISIINFLIDERPTAISAIAKKNADYDVEDLAYLFLYYDSGLMVHINTSWASPVKMRKMIIGGEKKMIIYDDIEPSNKLTVYEFDNSIVEDEEKKTLVDYRLGNIIIPKFEVVESLKNCLDDFCNAIKNNVQPLSSGESATTVIAIIENAILSLSRGGEKIYMK
jgi:predicted dehydrogenase